MNDGQPGGAHRVYAVPPAFGVPSSESKIVNIRGARKSETED